MKARALPDHPAGAAGLFASVVLLACLAIGCGDRAVRRALESDARGYLCGACTNRFQTPQAVIADVCPRCQSNDLLEVLGYTCSRDGHVTLGPRLKGAILCEQCGQPVSTIKLPTQAELTAWGAQPQKAADVSPR